jgi:hypothetical protein
VVHLGVLNTIRNKRYHPHQKNCLTDSKFIGCLDRQPSALENGLPSKRAVLVLQGVTRKEGSPGQWHFRTHVATDGPPPLKEIAAELNPKGDADERAVLEKTIEADRCYCLDRGCAKYGLWNAIHAKGSSSICRVLRIMTNRLDLPAELSAGMYRLRWLIEMFFRTFKQLPGCRHLFSGNHDGVEIQVYCGMIVCMLILISTGELTRFTRDLPWGGGNRRAEQGCHGGLCTRAVRAASPCSVNVLVSDSPALHLPARRLIVFEGF